MLLHVGFLLGVVAGSKGLWRFQLPPPDRTTPFRGSGINPTTLRMPLETGIDPGRFESSSPGVTSTSAYHVHLIWLVLSFTHSIEPTKKQSLGAQVRG